MPDVVPIEQLLAAAGFDRPEALARAREVLEARHLTRAGKQAIASSKIPAVEAALSETLIRICSDACLRLDREGPDRAREPVRVSPAGCEVCLGSNNRRAAIECIRALQRKRITRVVIVGGTGTLQQEIDDLLGGEGIEFRFVDGTATSYSARAGEANARWAQLIIIWASTPLKHAVSDHYNRDRAPHARVLTVSRRGIEALCGEIVKSYR